MRDALAVWAWVALLGIGGCASQPPDACITEHVASLPTVPAAGYLAVSVAIDDQPTAMVVDTGAQMSMIADGQNTALRLPRDPHRTTSLTGTGGRRVKVDNAIVSGLRFGDRETGELSLPVGSLVGPLTKVDPPLSGLIGLDVLEPYDLDIDRPGGVVGLYLRTDCDADRPEWTGRAARVPLIRAADGLLLMPVTVDGVTLEAVVDTGARRTMISETAMARLGLTDAAMSGDPATRSEGVDGAGQHGHLHRFNTLRIGVITFHQPRLDVGSTHLVVGDMLLGEDFYAHNRVWLSPSMATAFVALPNGGANGR